MSWLPSMYTGFAATNEPVTDSLIERYVRLLKVLGLLIVERSYVSFDGRLGKRPLEIYDDGLASGLEKLSSRAQAMGTRVVRI